MAVQVLARLYQLTRLYVNFFQPSFKLRHKTRVGARVYRSYFPPATPCDRLLESEIVDEKTKIRLRRQKASVDPVRLLHMIREIQSTLAALTASSESANGRSSSSKSLSEFLKEIPRLWKEGKVRATHQRKSYSSHYWRTRKDTFETVWPQLLDWLQSNPDIAATDLFFKLR